MQKKKIALLLGHPDKDSFSGSVAEAYAAAAEEAGHTVRRIYLGEMKFDPILWHGYKVIQELEPDLVRAQEDIKWADHLVVVYPNWWNTMPALLKGFFDRAWLPGFAFNFEKPSGRLIQRMKGKTARVIILSGTHSPIMTWLKFGDFTNEIARGILGFSGFGVRVSAFGPCEHCSDQRRQAWMEKVKALAREGA
ncbi:MAG: dehydrogenase [Candidatus Parcubacteria bacterium]|nr:MAG: dehydrogenase [Candidatus Parcubacteria bacterium]